MFFLVHCDCGVQTNKQTNCTRSFNNCLDDWFSITQLVGLHQLCIFDVASLPLAPAFMMRIGETVKYQKIIELSSPGPIGVKEV